MSYVTLYDLRQAMQEQRLIELTDDAGIGTVDENVVNLAIQSAASEVDGYVGVRYRVPMDPPHPLVKKLCLDLAVYQLHLRLDRVSDAVQSLYDNAVRLLRDISKGVVSLGAEPEPEASGHLRAVVRAPKRIFGRDDLDYMP